MKRFLFIIAAMVIALSACSGGDKSSDNGGSDTNQSASAGLNDRGDVPSGGTYGSGSENDAKSGKDDDGKTGPNDSIDGDGIIDDANRDGKDMMDDAKKSVDDAARGVGDGAKDVIDGAENAIDDVTGGNNANNNR